MIATVHDLVSIGLTTRQADHWTQRGYLKPNNAVRGSGHHRTWPQQEVDIARLMLRLDAAGWHIEVAASIARAVVEGWIPDPGAITIGPGLTLRIDPVGGDPA